MPTHLQQAQVPIAGQGVPGSAPQEQSLPSKDRTLSIGEGCSQEEIESSVNQLVQQVTIEPRLQAAEVEVAASVDVAEDDESQMEDEYGLEDQEDPMQPSAGL